MHPLLVSAVANTAGNILDRWSRGAGAAPADKAPEGQFRTMLDARTSAATAAPAKNSPAEMHLERATQLRNELLAAPEIRAVLDTADPTKPTTLSLSPDGRVLSTRAGYDPKPILLSPEIAEVARELASLTASRGGVSSASPVVVDSGRIGSMQLTPQTSLTTLR